MFFRKLFLIVPVYLVTVCEPSLAQQETRGRHHWTPAPYDTSTVQTVTGRIVFLEKLAATHRRSRGIHAMLLSGSDSVYVYLAPRWHVKKLEFFIEKGDTVSVTGSRVLLDGRMTLVAAELRKGARTLRFRNPDGSAAWWKRPQ